MWLIVLLAVFPFIIGSVMKPLEHVDETIWNNRIAEIILSTEDNTAKEKNPFFYSHLMIEDGVEGNYTSR